MTDEPDQPADQPAPSRRPLLPLLPLLAVGLVVAGTAATGFGAWVLPRDFSEPHPSATGLKVLSVVLVVVAAAFALGTWLGRRSGRPLTPATGSGGAGPVLSVLGVLTAGLLTWWSVTGAVEEASKGFLGLGNTSVAIGAVVALAGWALGFLVLRSADRHVPVRRGVVGVVGVGVVVAAVVGAAALVVPGVRLDATTASAAAVPDVPESVSEVAWRTPLPTRARDVVAAGPGVVVLLDDGVVGIDGETGEIRWSYRRDGAVAGRVQATHDGRTVLLQWRAGQYGRTQFVFLDPATGRVKHLDPVEGSTLLGSFAVPMSNTTYVGVDEDEGRVTGYSVRTGEVQWRYRTAGCTVETSLKSAVFARTVVLPLVCDRAEAGDSGEKQATARFVGFRDGPDPVWTEERKVPGFPSMLLNTTLGGELFDVAVLDETGDAEQDTFGLDPDTGEEVPYVGRTLGSDDGEYRIRVTRPDKDPDNRVAEVVDLDGEEIADVTDAKCADVLDRVVTEREVTCAYMSFEDYQRDGKVTLRVDGYDGTERTLDLDVGGPFGDLAFRTNRVLVPAPGAWVVFSGEELAKGGRSYLVGLR